MPVTVVLPALSARAAVPACSGSFSVALTVVVVATPVAPEAGAVPVTVGGVVSVTLVLNTTSTQ